LLTGIEGASSRPVRKIVLREDRVAAIKSRRSLFQHAYAAARSRPDQPNRAGVAPTRTPY
jgi:hypothetical protein